MDNYGGAENIEILINPDGTMKVILKEFAERDSQPELTELLESLNRQGIETVVRNSKTEYTGEYHKHMHSIGVEHHH